MKDHQSFLELIGMEEPKAVEELGAAAETSEVEAVSAEEIASGVEESELTPFLELTRSVKLARTEITHIDRASEGREVTQTERYEEDDESREVTAIEKTIVAAEAEVADEFPMTSETRDEAYDEMGDEQATARLGEPEAFEDPDAAALHSSAVEAELPENGTAHFDYTSDDVAVGRIVLLDGSANARAFHLNDLPLRLGRDAENHAVLNDSNASRFHAEIHHDERGFRILDIGSTNGIKINGQVSTEHLLQAHDIIQIGDSVFEFLPAGALSKGAPQIPLQSLPDTASAMPEKASRKKRILGISFLLLVAAGIYFYSQRGQIRQVATAALTAEVKTSLADVKAALESESQRSFDELTPDEVKTAFISKLEGLDIMKLVPEAQQEQLKNLPAPIVHVMLDDDQVVERILTSDYSAEAVESILRDKLNDLIVKKRYRMALGLAKIFAEAHPENETLTKAVEQLEAVVGEKTEKPAAEGLTADEKQFYESMAGIDKVYQSHIVAKKFGDALDYVRSVQDKLNQVLKMAPFLEKVVRAELEKWEGRVVQLELQVRDQKAHLEKSQAEEEAMSRAVEDIRLTMNLGEAGKAYAAIQTFMKDYPQASRMNEVKEFSSELNRMFNESFAATKMQVERSLQTQMYDQGWKQLYLFLDMAPHHEGAKELKGTLEKATRAKATQYYNQARVYEYEADDLIAAEQYYKRSFETADPRSDLATKADRRLAEVRRKLVR